MANELVFTQALPPQAKEWWQRINFASVSPEGEITCVCGRIQRMFRPHCVNCGSVNTYAKTPVWVEVVVKVLENAPVKGPVEIKRFRCRQCGVEFTEIQRCEAPVMQFRSMKERRAMTKAAELLSTKTGEKIEPEDVHAALGKLFEDAFAPPTAATKRYGEDL